MPPPPLPFSLLLLYFLNAVTQSLPMTAMGIWLTTDLHMSLSEQSAFYASSFLPWSMKPLFAYVMDNAFARKKRRVFAASAAMGVVLAHAATAAWVADVPSAFAWAIARSACEAVLECALGLVVIDLVGKDKSRGFVEYAQARTTAARTMGSIFAFSVGLGLYGCGANEVMWDPRIIIGITAVLPAIAVPVAWGWLPEPDDERVDKAAAPVGELVVFSNGNLIDERDEVQSILQDRNDDLTDSVRPSSSLPDPPEDASFKRKLTIFAGVIIFQFFFVWIGVQSMVPVEAWTAVMITMALTLLGGMVFIAFRYRYVAWSPIAAALLLFLLNASPSYDASWFTFKYYALKKSGCSLQWLLLFSEVASLFACWAYPKLTATWGTSLGPEKRLVFFTLIASLAGTLHIVLALDWENVPFETGTSVFAKFAVVGFITSFFGQLEFLAEQVYATENCYGKDESTLSSSRFSTITPGVLYGIFLSLLDFGDSASGWLAAPLVSHLNLSYIDTQYGNLWILILISTASSIVVVVVVPPMLRLFGRLLGSEEVKSIATISNATNVSSNYAPVPSSSNA